MDNSTAFKTLIQKRDYIRAGLFGPCPSYEDERDALDWVIRAHAPSKILDPKEFEELAALHTPKPPQKLKRAWKRIKIDEFETKWALGIYEIRVTGTDSGGRACRWGLWKNGQELHTQPSKVRKGKTHQITFDRVLDAKLFVDRALDDEEKT